jgi:predicted deacetylase
MAAGGRLIVSIHDVTPSQAAGVRYLLDACNAIGARPRVLKVIPNQDGHDDLRDYPDFAAMLRHEAADGSEIVLHGFTHTVNGQIRGWDLTAWRARLFAPSVAEFATLDTLVMKERLLAGRQILRDIGLDPQGFCAPGWLAPGPITQVLRQSGLRYYVSMLAVHDVATGRHVRTPWRGYMGAGPTQERLVRLGGIACAVLGSAATATKVFLHPQNAQHSADCAHVMRSLGKVVPHRQLVTYADLIAKQS